jgi:hypothetical protein
MSWMAKWAGEFPLHVTEAAGSHLRCADDVDLVDLCLGDTGAMTGHSPAAAVAAVTEQLARGITFMLPTADAAVVAEELAGRFGLPQWQVTLSATRAGSMTLMHSPPVGPGPRSRPGRAAVRSPVPSSPGRAAGRGCGGMCSALWQAARPGRARRSGHLHSRRGPVRRLRPAG